jgi:tetratricopeptide (TPR) repeat protein
MGSVRWSALLFTAIALGGLTATISDPPVESTVVAPAETPAARADLTEAGALVRAGDHAGAETLLATLQQQFPDDARLLLLRGEVLLALDKAPEALPLLQRAIELDPKRPRAHFQLAVALMKNGDRRAATEAFAKEAELTTDMQVRVMARLNRAMLFEQEREWRAAAAELALVLELAPERIEAYGDMATDYMEAGDLKEAERALSAGQERGFHSARHHYSLAVRYAQRETYDAAIRQLEQALTIDPALADAERSLAAALDHLGREQEAVEHLRRYVRLAPDAPDAGRAAARIREIEGR